MNDYFSQLPEDLIKIILSLLSPREAIQLCSVTINLYSNKNWWRVLAQINWDNYIPAFDRFTADNKWKELVYHLLSRRIIPMYNKIIVGYLVISPTATLNDLYDNLNRVIDVSSAPKTVNKLPLIELENLSEEVIHRGKIVILIEAQHIRTAIYPRFLYREFSSTLIDKNFIDGDKREYPSGNYQHLELLADNRHLSQISMNRLFETIRIYNRPILIIPRVAETCNLFNSIKLIYTV